MENEKASYFEKTKITSAGLRLIHKLIVMGEPLVITKAVIGDGISEQDPVTMTELTHEIPSRQTGQDGTSALADLQMYLPEDEQTMLTRVRVQNGDTEFVWHELGLVANDPDEGEILFAYTRDNTESAMTFPVFSGVPISATVDIVFFVHNSANVEMNVTLPAEVRLAEFNAHKNASELDHPDKSVKKRHIADYAIGTMQLEKGAVNNVRIGNNAVDARTIQDKAITESKLSEGVAQKFEKMENLINTMTRCIMRVEYTSAQGHDAYQADVKVWLDEVLIYNDTVKGTSYPPSGEVAILGVGYSYLTDTVFTTIGNTGNEPSANYVFRLSLPASQVGTAQEHSEAIKMHQPTGMAVLARL